MTAADATLDSATRLTDVGPAEALRQLAAEDAARRIALDD